MLRIHVLGPLQVTLDGRRIDLGTSRQRAVLARLVAAGGEVVSTDRFIDDLWQGQPPPKALAALQVYISNLRRATEPGRAPRTPATVIVSTPPGYRLSLPVEAVDAWRARPLIEQAAAVLEQGRAEQALVLLDELRGLWRGAAFGEFPDDWAAPEAVRLAELRLLALEYRAEAELLLGRPAQVVPELRSHVNAYPLRENGVRLLALAHYRSGSQAEALAVLREARRTLADELGVDPGPALQALERDILHQDPGLQSPPLVRPESEPSAPVPPAVPRLELVGRARELAVLREARAGVVWLAGEPGAGKSTLAEAFAAEAAAAGRRVAVGRCPETDGGAPPAWAWSEVVRTLDHNAPPEAAPGARLAPLLRDGEPIASQFQLARALAEHLAARTPLVIVLEDVHRADSETLYLLRAVATAAQDLLIVATHRPSEATDELRATLAALASASRHVELTKLAGPDVGRLLASVSGLTLDEPTVRTVAERTDGNALYVCEIARLLATDGPQAAHALPPGVRDLIRRRISRLPATAQTVLRNAATVGREAEVDVLVHMHEGDEDTVLDGLEAAVLTGLLTEPGPGRVRFAHVLVRETLYEGTARIRRTRVHGRVLAALEAVRPDDLPALAHHALQAASPDAVRYAAAAAVQASGLHAHREAAELRRAALDLATDDRTRLELMCGLVSSLGHAGDGLGALAVRRGAIELGSRIGDRVRALTCYDAPVSWSLQENRALDVPFVAAVEAELAITADAETRCRLLAALVFAVEGHDEERTGEASLEAVRLARELDRPDLLCLALNARYFAVLHPAGRDELAAIGAELLELGERHRLVGYLMQGHHTLMLVALGRNDLAAAAYHAGQGVAMASSGQLGMALVVLGFFTAARHLVAGEFDEAERLYTELAETLGDGGGINAAAMGVTCRAVVRLTRGDLHRSREELAAFTALLPPETGLNEIYALVLLRDGEPERARQVWRPDVVFALDYYWLVMTGLRAVTAMTFGDREVAERCYEELLPWSGEMAGLHSGSVTLGPVAFLLGELAESLGRDGRAHFEQALAVARTLGSAYWSDQALSKINR
ncbi:BTAD domain-containing putative transcriptional regulator [Nonomuraea sp. NPDC050328]|uniref:BTAD domain-containing putative transcriptional regulator n=1 Tax=Nonomuraea sp. NPDC050328 TaxID=3364361 RepID=UPI0037B16BE2